MEKVPEGTILRKTAQNAPDRVPKSSARGPRRDILALAAGLAARDVHILPGPVRATSVAAEDVDIGR